MAAAQDKLQTLTTTVATVNDVEQKQELVTQWQDLTVKVDAQGRRTRRCRPAFRRPVMPEPVVVAPDSTTSTTTSSETSGLDIVTVGDHNSVVRNDVVDHHTKLADDQLADDDDEFARA